MWWNGISLLIEEYLSRDSAFIREYLGNDPHLCSIFLRLYHELGQEEYHPVLFQIIEDRLNRVHTISGTDVRVFIHAFKMALLSQKNPLELIN